jgi:transposase
LEARWDYTTGMSKDEGLEQLRHENEILREGLKQALQALDFLQARVKELEQQQAKDSHNSHLPPSSERFVRAPKSLRTKSGKKPGGQPGHRGHHLQQVEVPDEILLHCVESCEQCQHDLRAQPGSYPQRRQVIDLPQNRLWVREHRVQEKCCPRCAHVTRAGFPAEVSAPAQYGRGSAALAVYLVEGQVLPSARASQLLQELLGVQLSAGSIADFVEQCHAQLAPREDQLKAALQQATLLHQDETPMRVGSEHRWVHVTATEQLTHYAAHSKRGAEALDAIGILPAFQGTSVHAGWTPYQGYGCQHALCNVHHLRELTFLQEELKQPWAGQMKELLLEMKAAVEQAKAAGKPELDVLALGRFHRRYEATLAVGYQANPPPAPPKKTHGGRTKQHPARNLLDRLSTFKWQVLAFVLDFRVPFSNNQAARDLRMIKVQQKVSGGFRTEPGSTRFCRIRSYLSTLRKQGLPVLSPLQQTLAGHPLLPAF